MRKVRSLFFVCDIICDKCVCMHDYFKQQISNMNMVETLLGICFDSNSALVSLRHMDVDRSPLSKMLYAIREKKLIFLK
jgi:hypothetical protein